jgi:hypothetical protein
VVIGIRRLMMGIVLIKMIMPHKAALSIGLWAADYSVIEN